MHGTCWDTRNASGTLTLSKSAGLYSLLNLQGCYGTNFLGILAYLKLLNVSVRVVSGTVIFWALLVLVCKNEEDFLLITVNCSSRVAFFR